LCCCDQIREEEEGRQGHNKDFSRKEERERIYDRFQGSRFQYARKKKVAQDIIRILVRRRERGFMTDLPPIILHAESISDK